MLAKASYYICEMMCNPEWWLHNPIAWSSNLRGDIVHLARLVPAQGIVTSCTQRLAAILFIGSTSHLVVLVYLYLCHTSATASSKS